MEKTKIINPIWPERSNIEVHWERFEQALGDLCVAWTEGHLVPVLEADMAAYLYHLFVSGLGGDASWFHLETRIYDGNKGKKADLAIGPVLSTEQHRKMFLESTGEKIPDKFRNYTQSKSSNRYFPPSVKATIILEFKHFRKRFNLKRVKEDIAKLSLLKEVCPEGRAVVLFIDNRLLKEEHRRSIVSARSPDDPNIRIYVCTNDKSGQKPWMLL